MCNLSKFSLKVQKANKQIDEIFVFFKVQRSSFLNVSLSLVTQECKVTNPDYTNMEKEDAVKDFLKRIEHYRISYETLDEEEESQYSFMKIFDAGKGYLFIGWLIQKTVRIGDLEIMVFCLLILTLYILYWIQEKLHEKIYFHRWLLYIYFFIKMLYVRLEKNKTKMQWM